MENKIEPNIITYNSLIYASSSCDRMDEAYQWLRMLEQSGIKPTDITFTTLLEAQIKTAKDKDKNWIPVAQAIVTAMRAQGLDPVPKLLVHVVRQLSWDRRCEEAMDIVDQIEATGKPAPKEMYEDIIEAYSHKGDQEGVLVALNRMRAYYSTNLSVFKSLDRVGCDINPQVGHAFHPCSYRLLLTPRCFASTTRCCRLAFGNSVLGTALTRHGSSWRSPNVLARRCLRKSTVS